MKHTKVKDFLGSSKANYEVNAKGWVRTFRNNQFIAMNDGSTINNIQCVVDFENTPETILTKDDKKARSRQIKSNLKLIQTAGKSIYDISDLIKAKICLE